MKRIFNIRPMLFLVLSLMLGIITVNFINVNNAVFYSITISLFFILFTLLILSFSKGKIKNKLKFINKHKILVLFMLVVYLVGALLFYVTTSSYENNYININLEETYQFEGEVVQAKNSYNSSIKVLLKNVHYIDDGNVVNLKSNLNLNIYYAYDINISPKDILKWEGSLNKLLLYENNKLQLYNLIDNVNYKSYVNISGLTITNNKPPILYNFKQNVYEYLKDNMTLDNANLSFAIIFGDKSNLSDVYYESYKFSGLAHLLAVSGLHIGLLVVLLIFILSFLKINKKSQFIIISVLLILYSFICSFSPSIVRASIMALVILYGSLIGERVDNLSSLNFAALIILIIWPESLFSAGFLLSYTSVLGIFLLYKPIYNGLTKIKLPAFVALSFSI